MYEDEDPQFSTIVIDVGSFTMKAGLSGDDFPNQIFPNYIAKNPNFAKDEKQYLIGSEAYTNNLDYESPFDGRSVTNWDNLERILHHTIYDQLKLSPEEFPIILTEHAMTEKSEREVKTLMMFETFNAPSFFMGNDSALSMYAAGRMEGVVINMGHEEYQIVPMYEGNILPHAISTINIGGRHVTDFLAEKLKDNGYPINCKKHIERDEVRDMKEKLCYVAYDYEDEFQKLSETSTFELPDGNSFKIKTERFESTEIFFNPSLAGLDYLPLGRETYNSICKLDLDGRRFWYSNILICGGTSCFEGMEKRITREIVALAPSSMRVKIVAPMERKFQAWIGGSILGSLSSFPPLCITKEEYEEVGPKMVHRKCF